MKTQILVLTTAAIVLPVAIWLAWPYLPALGASTELLPSRGTAYPASPLAMSSQTLRGGQSVPALIANVNIAQLDGGPPDVFACDSRLGRVVRCRRVSDGTWTEEPLGDQDLLCPCGSTIVDIDGDGDQDILVPVLGSMAPTPERVGRVVLLENDGQQRFTTRILFNDLGRVSDVQAGDLDGDGDLDLSVAEFGFDHGGVWWLENDGHGAFREHLLLGVPGCIHVPIADVDNDGDLDLVALVSQDDEQVLAFENDGGALRLRAKPLFQTFNFDLGTSGLVATDLDQDGRLDFLLSAGDNLEITYPAPQSWHGCFWLRNLGDWKFASERLSDLAGTYAAAAGDIDGDGDLDVALAAMFNDWRVKGMASCVWLENDGRQKFTTWQIADRPTHLATIDCADLDGDGRADIVGGALHFAEPMDRLGRIELWMSGRVRP